MATTITAGNATNGLAFSADNTGILEFKTGTGAGTTAVTISTAQVVNFVAKPTGAGMLTSGTAVASTSGTSIDFTGIPSTAKRVTIMFSGVSTSGTSIPQIQLGSTTILTSGYVGYTWTGNTNNSAHSTGFLLGGVVAATYALYGHAVLTNLSGNGWVFSTSSGSTAGNSGNVGGGSNTTLGGVLDRVRITTVNGTDTFDAGSINILWE